MTSPSRRKRPITARSTRPAKKTDGTGWLPAVTGMAVATGRKILAAGLLGLLGSGSVAGQQPIQKFVRPPRFAPPVHAQPMWSPRSPQTSAGPQPSIRQVSVVQDTNTAPSLDFSEPAAHHVADEWRSRARQSVQQTTQALQPTAQPSLHYPSPQSNPAPTGTPRQRNAGWQDLSTPDPSIPDFQITEQSESVPLDDSWNRGNGPDPSLSAGPISGPAAMSASNDDIRYPDSSASQPTIESYDQAGDRNVQSPPKSVLVRPETPQRQPEAAANQLRQTRPRRLDGGQQPLRNTGAARYRAESPRPGRQDTTGLEEFNNTQSDVARGRKSCEEFRTELLNKPITEIILDTSPLRPSEAAEGTTGGSRTWTDCNGNPLGVGTLVGLQRGYVVIEDESGRIQSISRTRLSDGDLAVVTNYLAHADRMQPRMLSL